MLRPVYEVAKSAAADSAGFGNGSAARTLASCVRRTALVVAGTAPARWLWQLAAACWAKMIRYTTTEAGRALGPMLPASRWEPWPFCVLRDSCHGGSCAGSARLAVDRLGTLDRWLSPPPTPH